MMKEIVKKMAKPNLTNKELKRLMKKAAKSPKKFYEELKQYNNEQIFNIKVNYSTYKKNAEDNLNLKSNLFFGLILTLIFICFEGIVSKIIYMILLAFEILLYAVFYYFLLRKGDPVNRILSIIEEI